MKDTCAEELDVAQEIIENLHEVVEKLRGSNRKLLRMLIEREQRIADLEASHKTLSADQIAISKLLSDAGIEHSGYRNQAPRVEMLVESSRDTTRKLIHLVAERNQRIADLERRYDKVIGWLAERNMLVADLEKQLGVSLPAGSVRLPAMALGKWEI